MAHAPFATIELRRPVQFGKESEPVTVLELRPNGQALRGLSVPMGADGEIGMVMMKPHELACVGLRMAGISSGVGFVDLMDPRDIWEVSQAVFSFIVGPPKKGAPKPGTTPSES